MKKILILFLSTIMIVSCSIGLGACSSNNASDGSSSIEQPNNPPEEQPANSPALAVEIPAKNSQVSDNISWPLKLSGYKTNINDATALGIVRETNGTVQPLAYREKTQQISLMSKNASLYTENTETNKSYIVKSTNEYNSNNPNLSSNGIEKIAFTKTITDEVRTEINGSKYIIARDDERTVVPTLTFDSVYNYIYYIYYENNLVLSNISDNCEVDINKELGVISVLGVEKDAEYEIRYNAIGEDVSGIKIVTAKDDTSTIKSTISFIPVANYKYSLYLSGGLVYENIEDNFGADINNNVGAITISNLEKDKEYEIRYEYTKNEIVVTQEEIAGEIDKLYVLGNYTFVSYVPNGMSQRPLNEDLICDTDGIATYDKCNYLSNGTDRQSFIIDNATGYVYEISDFHIKEIQGGCLLSADDNFIYDFKINENDEVEIFSLFTNDTIEWYSCFKDKYGNKFIQNNRLNTYDPTTNTYFYVFEPFEWYENTTYNQYITYELTSLGEAIMLKYAMPNNSQFPKSYICEAEIIMENAEKRVLTQEDNFEIFYDPEKYNVNDIWGGHVGLGCTNSAMDNNRAVFKVQNGMVYGYSHGIGYASGFTLLRYDSSTKKSINFRVETMNINWFNTEYLEKYGILIEYKQGNVYYYKNMWDSFMNMENSVEFRDDTWSENFSAICILENCNLSDTFDSFLTYGVHGNTYYEIVAEEINGEVVINQYVKGTYQKPQIKIILQPLNK